MPPNILELLEICHALHLELEIKYELHQRTFCSHPVAENSCQFYIVEHFDDLFQLLFFSFTFDVSSSKRKVGRRQFKFLSHCKLWFVFAVRICFLGTFVFLLKNEDCCNSNQNVNLNSFVTVWDLKQQKKMAACTMTKILSKL